MTSNIDWSQVITAAQKTEVEALAGVPTQVTMAQCRLALFDLAQIETDEQFFGLVNVLPEADRARALLELRTRPTVEFEHPLVVAACDAMGWDRIALFKYAVKQ